MEKTYEAIGTALGALIVYLIGSPILNKLKALKQKTRFHKRLKTENEINKILTELRVEYGFNRASLIEYHNGTTSLGGFSFKNATMTNESTDENTRPIIFEVQSIPCSLAASMLVQLESSKNGFIVINEDFPDERIRITHRMYGVKQAWNFKIGNSLIDGCVSLISNQEEITLSPDDILNIKARCQKILMLKKGFIS